MDSGLALPLCLAGLARGEDGGAGRNLFAVVQGVSRECCGEWRSIRFDSDQQGRRVSGSGWASDDAATRLAGGFTVTVRLRCGGRWGARRGRKQGARRAAAATTGAGCWCWCWRRC